MGSHLIEGKFFQSDKYPSTPRGKVPLSVNDPTAQDLLWEYAQRRRTVDAEFSADLEEALRIAGYKPATKLKIDRHKLNLIVGPGSKILCGIVDDTGTAITVEDDGTVLVTQDKGGPDGVAKAIEIIQALTGNAAEIQGPHRG
jgi:hypothetical protein